MRFSAKILASLAFLLLGNPAAQAEDVAPFTLRPGDVLQITVWKEEGMDQETVVLPDGTITFPLIGTIKAQNRTPADLQLDIKIGLSRMIPDAAVTVIVKAPLGHTVSVMGQVAKPGNFVMGQKISVMQALSQAGGLTPYADENDIIILRMTGGEKESIPFPYDDVSRGRALEKDITLQPGDVIFVPTAGLF